MAKARILYVDHHSQMGGAERSLLCLLKYLDRTRFEPILASAPSSPLAEEARKLDVQVEPVRMDRLRSASNPAVIILRLKQGAGELVRIARKERVAIIHSNVMRASVYAALAARLGRVKLVWHVRDIYRERLYRNVMARAADRIIATSNAVAASLPSTARHKMRVVYNGVDLDEFVPQRTAGRFREKLGIPGHSLVFGSVAWIAPWKRQHLFLTAAAQIAAKEPDAVFVLIGGLADERYADYYGELQRLAQGELKDRVIFAGHVPEAAEALAGIDVLVHTADAEPFGRVLVEAMAMEKPVIAPRSGGPQEIIEHDETGILVPDDDATVLAEAMLLLARDRKRAREMGLAGRRRVEMAFNASDQARKVEQVYDEILSS